MRALYVALAMVVFATTRQALAESKWLESRHIAVEEIKTLCARTSDVRQLARMQMISSGDNHWRRLAQQELVIETTIMGVPPLDAGRCYVVVRAGRDDESKHRAFEVYDFAVGPERTSVLVIGRGHDYEPPPGVTPPGR